MLFVQGPDSLHKHGDCVKSIFTFPLEDIVGVGSKSNTSQFMILKYCILHGTLKEHLTLYAD
jgi:hypothetical protein